MKIAIISAMEKEMNSFYKQVKNLEKINKSGFCFKKCTYNNHDLILTVSGIGKTNSGLLIGSICTIFEGIDLIINIGISGGIKNMVLPGDVVISEKLSYADVDVTVFDEEYGKIPGMPKIYYGDKEVLSLIDNTNKVGMILSGDSFYIKEEVTSKIINKYFSDQNVMCFDMESTAFAQGCYHFKKRFIAIRAISDIIGEEKQKDTYIDYCHIASEKCVNCLEKILKEL